MPLNPVDQRPIAIDPLTMRMNPDGIFLKSQSGGLSLMRVKFPLRNLNVPGLSVTATRTVLHFDGGVAEQIQINNVGGVPSSVLDKVDSHFYWLFLVNLATASIGKHELRFTFSCIQTTMTPHVRSWQTAPLEFTATILVMDGGFDLSTMSGWTRVPEGRYAATFAGFQVFQKDRLPEKIPCTNRALALPNLIDTQIVYTTPFAGVHGPLPFNDPWWKAAGLVVAIIAAVVAGIWALGGALGWWESPIQHTESGSVDPETGQACRECRPAPAGQGYTSVQADPIWGAFLTAAALGLGTFLAELVDVYYKAESTSAPNTNDKTVREDLSFRINYDHIPMPGTPFKISGSWNFVRHGLQGPYSATTGNESETNINYLTGYTVKTADGGVQYSRATVDSIQFVVDLGASSDWARYKREQAKKLRKAIPEFYVYGYLRHRQTGALKSAIFHPQGNTYVGNYAISLSDDLGHWDLMIVIQNVNTANPSLPALEQAPHMGGFFFSKNFSLKHESGTCVIRPDWDASIELVP